MTTGNRTLGQRVFFVREGEAITGPPAGTVGRTFKPGDGDAAWVEFGDVDEFGVTPEGQQKEVWSPGSGGILQLKDIIINKPKTTIEFRTAELSPIAFEMLYRTAKLDGASTAFTPHAKIQTKGVLRYEQRDQNGGDAVNVQYAYGLLEVAGKVDSGEDIVRVPFRFTCLFPSSLNNGTLDT